MNPLGTVPVLTMEDKHFVQHLSICRYLAKSKGLTSGSAFEDYVQVLLFGKGTATAGCQ